MDKSLIEEGSFELIKLFHLISEEAIKEKNATPPINEMLYWWTRKPLIVARSVVLTSTLNDIQSIKNLLGLDKIKRAFNYRPNVTYYTEKMRRNPSEIMVLDPFGGAGNLIFEAQRLGLDCYVNEYNPVAYLIMRSVLEYPSKYGERLADDFIKYCNKLIGDVGNEIGKFFVRPGRKPITYLWVWCIRCPYCGQRVPLTNNMWLVNTVKKRIGIRFIPNDGLNFKVEFINGISEKGGKDFTQKGGKAICIRCRNSIDYAHITNDITNNQDREMIAVVVHGAHAKDYEPPTEEDKQVYLESGNYLRQKWNIYEEEGLIPNEEIRPSHRRENLLWHYGIRKWYQYFSSRQLLVIVTMLKNIKKILKEIPDPEYAKVIATYLTLFLCKHVNYNCYGVAWHSSGQKLAHALSFRRPSMVYNHAEVNPFEETSGGLEGMLNSFVEGIKFASLTKNSANVNFTSVFNLSSYGGSKFDLIITDPPYSDDVQYGELSEFFYVWLYRALKDVYPDLPPVVQLDEDICVAWGRFENLITAKNYYREAMREAFKQVQGSLKDDGLLVLFFAHSSTEAWDLLLEVLRQSRLRVVSSYAVHTESTANVIARKKTSFMSSIIVTCRKVLAESTSYFEDLLPKIEDKVKDMLASHDVDHILELPMTDLLIMTYGKVLEEATQYTVLKSYRTDFKPEFENLIKDAREFILKEIVTTLTGRSLNSLGPDTSFYIVTKLFYKGLLDSNEALKVAWAYQVKIEDLQRKEIARKESGIIKLLFYDEIHIKRKPDEIDRNNLHQQLLYLENLMDREGVSALKRGAAQSSNFRIQDLKQIINLLIKGYRVRLNKKETLTGKEQKELRILESLADVFNLSTSGGRKTLDEFAG